MFFIEPNVKGVHSDKFTSELRNVSHLL